MGAEIQPAKRILMTTDAVGGIWQYSLDLIRQLTDSGVKVVLICLGPPPTDGQQRQAKTLATHFFAAPYPLEWTEKPWDSIEQARTWLTELENEFKPDVVHLNSYALAAAPWQAPVLCVAHSCVYSWWRAVHGCAPDNSWRSYKDHVTRGLQAAAAVVAPSRAMLHSVVSEYEVAPEKTTVIPNFSMALSPSQLSKEHLLLAAGRMWDKAKNFPLLQAIAPHLKWPLYLAGSSEGDAAGSQAIRYLGALAHEQVLQRMAVASVFVHPALYEPFGLAVLEAAVAGCCLVLADIPSLRELWHDAAVFVNPRDPQAWITMLNQLIENEAQRHDFAERASRAARRYCAATSSRMYRDTYDRLATRKSLAGGVAA